MVQLSPDTEVSGLTSEKPINLTTIKNNNERFPADIEDERNSTTESVAAVTIAVLAVVIVITMLLVFRALRKRQRARRGEQFGETTIPTITTGVMGTGGAAYSNNVQQSVPVRGQIRWESINPSGGDNPSSGSGNTSQSPYR